ncbi:hypothetical protein PUMCH_001366 [Australozyma saopauloensis]|uniref:Zn(2)-C6 fungal-type domain-containing protein n=1 Tax=Australozyma saopauloensis TaxID=291208 RepID=A0AAX4H6H8_9ASCO|nr:hypothetical protein PUMCH_001366 [[Candida] saopauloensis]
MNGQLSNNNFPPLAGPPNAGRPGPNLSDPKLNSLGSSTYDLHNMEHSQPAANTFVKKQDPSDDPGYLDWASNLLMGQNPEFMASPYDFPTTASAAPPPNNPIMQRIQYQNSVYADNPPEIRTTTTKQRRPCDNCRRRKTKCLVLPGASTCSQCDAKDIACTFNSHTHSKEPEPKRAKLNDSVLSHHDIIPPNVPIRTVAPVQDYSAMNNSLLKKTLSLQFPRSSFYVGPTSYLFDNNLLEVVLGAQAKPPSAPGSGPSSHNKIEQVNLSDSILLRKVGPRTQFVLKDDQSKHSFQNMTTDVDSIEKFIAPHGQILIDLYFRIIHPSYPVLHKKVFLEKYSRTHREFNAPLLAAVYVLAIQWWDYDPHLNRYPKPNVELILKIALTNYTLEILKRPKLSAVQAGLLLLQCKHILHANNEERAPKDSISQASALLNSSFNDSDYNDWVLCSQVVALAEELGLGLDCDNWKLPKWERGLRKRLAWAVYLEDKWLSLKNSRPLHINDINFIVLELAEEDFPEKHGDGDLKEGSSDITNGKKNFMNLIGLSAIVSEILDSFFSMKAMRDITDINEVLRIAKPIQLKLRLWYHSLPVELQMNSVQPRKLCSNGYLQLAYFAAELTLHRKIITTIYQQSSKGSSISEELVTVCRTAAKTRLLASIEFVRDLKPEHIHSFWHCSSTSNITLIGTFAALLFISATSKEEAESYKEHIFNYRWILKISSKGFPQVSDALQKLDLVLNQIPGLLTESTEQPTMVPNVPTIDHSKTAQKLLPFSQQPMRLPSVQSHSQQAQNLPSVHQVPTVHAAKNTEMNSPMLTYGQNHPSLHTASNSLFLSNQAATNRANSSVQNREKDNVHPGSAQSFRIPSHASVQSPYNSPQPFQQGNTSARGSQVGNSPHSSRGLSPEIIRLQKYVTSEDYSNEQPGLARHNSHDSLKQEN